MNLERGMKFLPERGHGIHRETVKGGLPRISKDKLGATWTPNCWLDVAVKNVPVLSRPTPSLPDAEDGGRCGSQ